jgi:hypothetical protein
MNKPSRRAVVRTGVWAVPAVATVAAAPAFAATSGPPPVTIGAVGSVCKDPGEGQNTKDYEFTLTFTNTTASSQTVLISNFNFKDRDNTPVPASVIVPANTSMNQTFKLTNFDDSSSNPLATISYSVSGAAFTASVTFATPIKPCKD